MEKLNSMILSMSIKIELSKRIIVLNDKVQEINQMITQKELEIESLVFTLNYMFTQDVISYFQKINNKSMLTFLQIEFGNKQSILQNLKYEVAELKERKELLTLEHGMAIDLYNFTE